jgi:hypothetical protein
MKRPLMLTDLQPDRSPYCPPDWRWQTARILLEERRRLRRPRKDPWVQRALRFQRDGARLGGERHPRLVTSEPAIVEALSLLAPCKSALRHEVEARVLADQPGIEIAALCGCSVEALEAFESLFFDARVRLPAKSWILHNVLGPRIYDPGPDDLDVLVKLLAYTHGQILLDAVLDEIRGEDFRSFLGGVHLPGNAALDSPLKLWLATMTLPVNNATAAAIIALYCRMESLERQATANTAGEACGPVEVPHLSTPTAACDQGGEAADLSSPLENVTPEAEHTTDPIVSRSSAG